MITTDCITALGYIGIAVLSYLLGSLNFGVILSRKLENDDVRNHGSGNAGTTNMLRSYGKLPAILTIIGDMVKVGVAIVIAFFITKALPNDTIHSICTEGAKDYDLFLKMFAGLFCVLGHLFPCYFNFKGGKGVATSGGMVFIIDWRIALILLAMFIVIVILTKYVSLGSLVMAVFFPVFMGLFHRDALVVAMASVFTIIVVVAHRSNIKKLLTHTESKISSKSKSE